MSGENEPVDRDCFTLVIEPGGFRMDAPAVVTLFEAAQLAGIVLPTSCRNGTCRTCMCRMTSGSVRYEIAWPGLTREEKEDGYVLPCVAHAADDVVLHIPAAKPEP
ncbi:2Fe-2S iron-sulfur cluster binding domain-containing protein [Oxalobacteraceae bacterium OM1]|nr:2Fe-2S iron-sulfur cluster binding domain-containing protein [Oxalobacteraceae bacterium OM1]